MLPERVEKRSLRRGARAAMLAGMPKGSEDERWMRRALRLARRGIGTTHPNPRVGCVIVKGGELVAEGWHERPGGPHAEAAALAKAGERARGATLYVNLEPCAAHGRTPPCTEAILRAGIARVVIGCRDPNPKMQGGAEVLAQAGVEVEIGVCAHEAERINRPFFRWVKMGRPWVLVKAAASLDGRLATRTGESRWITGERARAYAHRLRAEQDAILIGAGTLQADNPRLTVRGVRRRGPPPLRVVVAEEAPPFSAEWAIANQEAPTRLYVMRPSAKDEAWRGAGVEVVNAEDIHAMLAHLAEEGRLAVMVEGGGGLIGALLRAQLVDELALFLAPILIGGDGVPLWRGEGASHLGEAPRLVEVTTRSLGSDLLVRGLVAYPNESR